ncbi:MAG: cell division protein ZapE, partial [Pseudomonadota bacterium]
VSSVTARERYEACVASGELERSDAQVAVLDRMVAIGTALEAQSGRSRAGFLGRLFGARSAPEAATGLYVWGGVGRGKTMLMDLFFEACAIEAKQRVHFHAFMSDVHDRIGRARKEHPGDPIPIVARDIAADADLLCFDELHVTDIADAMILGRLFRGLFAEGITVIATSNLPPQGLYRDGLNRDLFKPFIALIEEHMAVHHFGEGVDYRLQKLAGRQLYFDTSDPNASAEMDAVWDDFTDGAAAEPATVTSLGRTIAVPAAVDGVARFRFADLCARPLGARDYLAIAKRFHTVFLDHVPQLGPEKRNEARRFINLVDTLYDTRTCLVVSAAAQPDDIYVAGDGVDLFARTASRLIDMRSQDYLTNREARIHALRESELRATARDAEAEAPPVSADD